MSWGMIYAVIATSLAFAGVAAELKEASLIAKADVIAIVKEQTLVKVESGLLLTLSSEDVLKGKIPSGGIVTATVPVSKRKTNQVRQPMPGCRLVFLQKNNQGYMILPPRLDSPENYGFTLPSGLNLDAAAPPDLSVEARVLNLVTRSIEYTHGRSVEAMAAVDLLRESSVSAAAESVQGLQGSSSSCVKAVAIAVGVAQNKTEALRELTNNFATYSLCPAAHVGGQYISRFYSLDPEAIKYLGILATSSPPTESPGIGMSASEALERLHTKEAVPYLIKLLDDPRDYLRPLAINGLSAYVQGLLPVRSDQTISDAYAPYPLRTVGPLLRHTTPHLHTDPGESDAVAFWKAWFADHRAEFPDQTIVP